MREIFCNKCKKKVKVNDAKYQFPKKIGWLFTKSVHYWFKCSNCGKLIHIKEFIEY